MWTWTVLILAGHAIAADDLAVKFSDTASNLSVLVDGIEWFRSDALMVSEGGKSFSVMNGTLTAKHTRSISGTDVWGMYDGRETTFVADDGPRIIATTKVYSHQGVVSFVQTFPDGLLNASANHLWNDVRNGVSSIFPAFQPTSLPNLVANKQRRWMAYNGWDCTGEYGCVHQQGNRVALGLWDDNTTVLPGGLEGSGPLAIMSASGDRTVVISSAKSFMAASQQMVPMFLFPSTSPDPLKSFSPHPGDYCGGVANYHWAYAANNVSLEHCAAKCVEFGCEGFDYSPSWPRPQPYCFNCRVLPHGLEARATPSTQNYTCYTRPTPPRPPGQLSYGLVGTIEAVPPGFSLETVMVVGPGPNAAVRRWGGLLARRYHKNNSETKDFTTTHLGYDTDNGAFYYYNPEKGKTYAQTLLDVHAYARAAGIPFRHVQLDSWWYVKGAGGGTKSWTPGPNTFPDGLSAFHRVTGWNITAHNRMWATDNVYAKRNGGNFSWIVDKKVAVPTQQEFWHYLMTQGKGWGLYVYEQDWLFTELVGSPTMLASATLGREWLTQMDTAAQTAGLVIQYCMLWPRFALQSLELPAVTTARASTDYRAGGKDQWNMGLSSLFLDSLELRPTKDNFFSTDKQGDGRKGVERFNRLQAVISTLSTGPVFPSDAVNSSDVALILRSCDSDGRLLRPDQAATSMDQNILGKALARGTGSSHVPGELMSTTATADGVKSYMVLAAKTDVTTVTLQSLGVGDTAAEWVAFETNSSSALTRLGGHGGKTALTLPVTDRWTFNLWTVVQVLSNGYAFLGEAQSKWVSISPQRFTAITASPKGIEVTATGASDELLHLSYARPGSSVATTFQCTVGPNGIVHASIPAHTCTHGDSRTR